MEKVLVHGRPRLLGYMPFFSATYCPGCHQPQVHKILCELIDELGIEGRAIGVSGVGCGTYWHNMASIDGIRMAHGRPPDGASAIKRIYPDAVVITYQGDGDCFAIGAGPTISAANRGEKITIIMGNNANYGSTGGQLAPTTPTGMVTSTTPLGRGPEQGYPAHVPEVLAAFKGVAYTARGALTSPALYQKTKGYIRTAIQKQMDNVGMSMVEVLCACPPNWHKTPLECLDWMEKEMMAEYPLGEFKNVDKIE